MPQTEPNATLLGRATRSVNPRHQADIDSVEAHDQAQKDLANPNATVETPVVPTHDWEKRYKDLQRYKSKQEQSWDTEREQLKNQNVQPLLIPKTPEEMASMRTADPEGYARIEAIAANMVQTQMGTYDTTLATLTNDLTSSKIDKAQLEIRKVHPDFDSIIDDDRFHQWAERQSAELQKWIYENPTGFEQAIQAISLYKYEQGLGTTHSAQANQVPVSPQGDQSTKMNTSQTSPEKVDRNNPTYVWTESEISRMRPAEFGQWEQHITLAQNENRIAFGQ